MQKVSHYQRLKALFTPVNQLAEVQAPQVAKPRSAAQASQLTQTMPALAIAQGLDQALKQGQPIYLTVSRQNGPLLTKDILFGSVKEIDSQKERIIFAEALNPVTHLIALDRIQAVNGIEIVEKA
ncbi:MULTISPECIES: hypothetical protein [Aerococcus]|uniref:YolD-like family protein n=1 Tax=Aerococcus sanguinicola TaxID=119206 RepID=A0A5N1GKP7_9LACT|nr:MULTISPECIES: hypothetical protein [Aerococcus]KAA9300789.1 hypothetical protein F6I03_05645 [Aerococcus sanguinicola]MDK6369425.1 hypothetical protein [Aerococcus sp. UMB9870]MDK6680488.1 hypothetical protein [Aerococcus sp. UMB8608]MDK6686712.1 hypothetical protein [Aerococcus sp. UMB8623]MDK6940435.1 hypothetical protein [Aerococcus sp. UMB8487]